MDKNQAVEWLRGLGLFCSGRKEDIIARVAKYKKYPNLVKKLQKKASWQYKFESSLDPIRIPPPSSAWKNDLKSIPRVNQEIFYAYAAIKKEGSTGQQEKAVRMLQSRKIVSVKCFLDASSSKNEVFIKAMIKKSYGNQSRPAVVKFEDNIPRKGHCNCPVGASGLCCHVLALLLFVKHFHETGEKLLELTCTEQLQKWHKRSNKGSIPMIPLKDIKVQSAQLKKKGNQMVLSSGNTKTTNKRDISEIQEKIAKTLGDEKSINDHFYNVLSKSKWGRNTSLGQHLVYKYNYKAANHLADHNYVSQKHLFDENIINLKTLSNTDKHESNSRTKLLDNIEKLQFESISKLLVEQDCIEINFNTYRTLFYPESIESKQLRENINEKLKNNLQNAITIDLSLMEAPKPAGFNYIDVNQNTDDWKNIRKYKVTGSRLPGILGFYGSKKFTELWDVVKNGTNEKDISNIINIKRGHFYENEALQYFMTKSKATAEKCGFFVHPTNSRFGSSPDAIGPAGLIIEIKTRALNSEGPLKSLDKFPGYFIQTQLQMACTDANFCLLVSYHPESKSGNFFLIQRDNVLIDVMIQVCNFIYNDQILDSWYHNEIKELQMFGQKFSGKHFTFENLKTLRTYIKNCSKNIVQVHFVDEFDITDKN